MIDYNAQRRFIKARQERLVGRLAGRNSAIRGVFIHSTRSGRSQGDDGPGTENWANHPENAGAFWDMLIYESGQQVKCTRWEEDEQPLWAAGYGEAGTWNAQAYYLHLELAQGTINDPFTAEQLESAAQWIAELSNQYEFEPKRIDFLEQRGDPPEGLCDHEHSANGRRLGKSDPGPRFPWGNVMSRIEAIRQTRAQPIAQEAGMTKDEVEAAIAAGIAAAFAERERIETRTLGSTQLRATAALVRRQRAMGRATTLADVIKANDPMEVPE